MTLKSIEHAVHEETASISLLIIQGMEVLKITNTQELHYMKFSITAGNWVQSTLRHRHQNYTSRFQVSEEKPASTAEPLYIRKTGL